jgi:SRSO17 transposase
MTEKLLTEIVQHHFPGIKNLRINVNEKGFKVSFNDKRYDFSEVYRVVRDYVLEKQNL